MITEYMHCSQVKLCRLSYNIFFSYYLIIYSSVSKPKPAVIHHDEVSSKSLSYSYSQVIVVVVASAS